MTMTDKKRHFNENSRDLFFCGQVPKPMSNQLTFEDKARTAGIVKIEKSEAMHDYLKERGIAEEMRPGPEKIKWRMYFWVMTGLGMKKGKTAGQVGHAAARIGRKIPDKIWEEYLEYEVKYVFKWPGSLDELRHEIKKTVENLSRPLFFLEHLVIDAGKSQVEPGSETVYGIFTSVDLNPLIEGRPKYRLL